MIGVSVEAFLPHDLLLPAIFWCIDLKILRAYVVTGGRHGCLMVGALVSRSSGLGSSPAQRHCFVFLDKTVYTLSASLSTQVYKWLPAANLMLVVTV